MVSAWATRPPVHAILEPQEGPRILGQRALQAQARFVVRQTAPHPIVGPKVGADLFRNSLHALLDARDELGVETLYLVALLNSEPLRAIYRALVRESGQRVFPQVKIASLRRLPMITPTSAEHARIVDLGRARLDGDLSAEPRLAREIAQLYAP